jgi:hypothetical protein
MLHHGSESALSDGTLQGPSNEHLPIDGYYFNSLGGVFFKIKVCQKPVPAA